MEQKLQEQLLNYLEEKKSKDEADKENDNNKALIVLGGIFTMSMIIIFAILAVIIKNIF